MPHVVTQPCCSDASCAYACPVNCIHPTPDEPDFLTAEMLHIDPASCVDCGACVPACPVDAIVPQRKLTSEQLPFVEINRAFYRNRDIPRPLLAPVIPPPVARRTGRLRVAIVGSGPAAMYAADELMTLADVEVDIYERLSEPYGLARFGVAPDHLRTRQVANLFDIIGKQEHVRMHLNTEVGKDISLDELRASHHAVLYATGAATDRKLDIPGADLSGVTSATDFVAWYNGHPDCADTTYDLSAERVVIVGNGNVALDVARILTLDPDELAGTTISPGALTALRESNIREVVVAGRRGPAQSACTVPELNGLLESVTVRVDTGGAGLTVEPGLEHSVREKLRLLASANDRPARSDRQVTLRYLLTPQRILGEAHVTGMAFAHTVLAGDGSATVSAPVSATTEVVPAGLVLSSIGYRALPITGLPFDDVRAVVPNDEGRVETGLYVAGWIKRGPSGFIGTNKSCAQETVRTLVDDFNAGLL